MLKKTFILVLVVTSVFICSCKKAQNGTEADRPNEGITGKETMPVETIANKVQLSTNKGDIIIELDKDKAPVTVENFLSYVNDGYYNGLIFHRVIPNFMIQGGGMTEFLQPKQTRDSIKNEASNGLKNLRGTIAMARTSIPDSATSQFYINLVDNNFLDYTPANPGYAVFGKVVEGMDVVDAIGDVQTTRRAGFENVPVETVKIFSIEIIE